MNRWRGGPTHARPATAKQTWYCVHLQLKSIVESSRILINEVFFRNLYMAAACLFGIMLNCELWKAEMMFNLHLYATLSQLRMFWFIDHVLHIWEKRNLFCKAPLHYYRTFNYTCTWNFFIEFPTNYQYNLCTKMGHEKKLWWSWKSSRYYWVLSSSAMMKHFSPRNSGRMH